MGNQMDYVRDDRDFLGLPFDIVECEQCDTEFSSMQIDDEWDVCPKCCNGVD